MDIFIFVYDKKFVDNMSRAIVKQSICGLNSYTQIGYKMALFDTSRLSNFRLFNNKTFTHFFFVGNQTD